MTISPLHPRCRCAIIYDEIGAPRKTPPKTYREKPPPELHYKPVSEERYNQLIIPLKKMNVIIHRDAETTRHLDFLGVEAVTIGAHDVLFREKVSVSAILEETCHIRQNRHGMNDDKDSSLRTILNEIAAKKYLLLVALKYGIPREEIETTENQLKQYREDLKTYEERHDDKNDVHSD